MLVTKFSIDKSKQCTPAWLNLRTLLTMQFLHIQSHVCEQWLTHSKDCNACSLWKDVPLHNFLTYMDVFAWKCSHRSTCLHKTCHTISYVVLDRHVSTQCVYYETYSCACSHTKRRLSVHFVTYEVMPMRNFKHITPCLSHNFSRCTWNGTSVLYVNSCMQRRVRKFRSRVVVFRFRYIGGKLCDKQGVMC